MPGEPRRINIVLPLCRLVRVYDAETGQRLDVAARMPGPHSPESSLRWLDGRTEPALIRAITFESVDSMDYLPGWANSVDGGARRRTLVWHMGQSRYVDVSAFTPSSPCVRS